MSRFIQIHLLTAYPPANLNRDDLGRPKTAKMGGVDRLRVSSQSLKRHWRTSDLFEQAMSEHIGIRTKMVGVNIYKSLIESEIKDKDAHEWSKSIAGVFGKNKKTNKEKPIQELEIEQLVHIGPSEQDLIDNLVAKVIEENRAPEKEELDFLRNTTNAVDIALFGRMLASKPAYNIEAACQVAHAISVHPIIIEDDYFTAVDDLNTGLEESGSAHIGETGFAAGLFYSYLCINKEQLIENLDNNTELANKAIAALIEAAVKVSPSGKQNSFAHQGYASYVLAEMGNQQPRSLSVAYLKPIDVRGIVDDDYLTQAVSAIRNQYESFDQVYGSCADSRYELSVNERKGTLPELLQFVANKAE